MSTALNRTTRLIAALAVPIVFAAATPAGDGMTYDFIMKSTSKATGNKEQVTLRGRGTYAGDQAKIEIIDASANTGGDQAFGGKGTYFIVKNGGEVMYLVDPNQKQYMKWNIGNMLAGMSKVVNAVGGLVKMQMSDIKIEAQDLGAGEAVQGYPTHHIRMTQNYTVSASIFGRHSTSKSETTTDYYFAPSLTIANPFVASSDQMAMMSQFDMFNNPDYKTQMAAAQAKLPKKGVPLKMVTTSVTTDEKGKQETSTSTMEMVNFKPASVPASAFAIPSGYTEIEMPNLNAALTANGNGSGSADANKPGYNADSVAKAAKEGAKEGVDQTVKDGTKQAVSKKLRGIFKH